MKPPIYGVSLYKYAWTLFKQQRYETAVHEFVHLLNYTDQVQKETGDPGADFRGEAYTYIADSLTNLDFKGPDASEPYIARPDIIDTEPRPEVAEVKLHIAVDRVKDPSIIPQDKPWTIEIYKALASEFRSLNEFHNAIEIYQDILKTWPLDPTAPVVQNSVAETYDQLNMTLRAGTPEHDANAAKALEARTLLASYIGTTPWTDANKDNPGALQNAERLVRGGLRQAAAQHTNNGKGQLIAAGETSDPKLQQEYLNRALAEYKLAAIGWEGFVKQDENAPDAYESKYWLADAKHNQVRIQVILHKLNRSSYPEPSPQEVDAAKVAAVDVRDSDEDDKYLQNAGLFVVDESDIGRDLEYQRYDDTKGSSGFELRTAVKFDGSGPGHAEGDRRPDSRRWCRRAWPRARSTCARPAEHRRDAPGARLPAVRGRGLLPLRALRRGEGSLRAHVPRPLRQGHLRLQGLGDAHLDGRFVAGCGAGPPARRSGERALVRGRGCRPDCKRRRSWTSIIQASFFQDAGKVFKAARRTPARARSATRSG